MTSEQLEQLLERKRQQEQAAANEKREAYEGIKSDILSKIETEARAAVAFVRNFHKLIVGETSAFYGIMKDYGALKKDGQRGYSIANDKFKVEVKSNKIKKFDERADIAAERLIEFLTAWIKSSDKGSDDPMYQLAMTLLERNKHGDLDYKSVSKLYDLEAQFNDPEYSDIMRLFKESNLVEGSVVNFYFFEKTDLGVWLKLEPSFKNK